jgi:hypothetical protein
VDVREKKGYGQSYFRAQQRVMFWLRGAREGNISEKILKGLKSSCAPGWFLSTCNRVLVPYWGGWERERGRGKRGKRVQDGGERTLWIGRSGGWRAAWC